MGDHKQANLRDREKSGWYDGWVDEGELLPAGKLLSADVRGKGKEKGKEKWGESRQLRYKYDYKYKYIYIYVLEELQRNWKISNIGCWHGLNEVIVPLCDLERMLSSVSDQGKAASEKDSNFV